MIAGSAAATPDRRAKAQVAPARDFIRLMGILPVDKSCAAQSAGFPVAGGSCD
jgi:hypothetical protein